MALKCPVCLQVLPRGVDEQAIHRRVELMQRKALEVEKARVRRDLEGKFAERAKRDHERVAQRARAQAKSEISRELSEAKAGVRRALQEKRDTEREQARFMREQMKSANIQHKEEIRKLQLASARDRARAETDAVRAVEQNSRKELRQLQTAKANEQARYEQERSSLQERIADLSRKLERETSEQRGEKAEVDLHGELCKAFREDKIQRVGKGKKGADIIHTVRSDGDEVGRIVYESKNVSAWKNAFVKQAKRSQRHHCTPYVLVVTSAFPRKQNHFCVVDGIPVVSPRLAVSLAGVIRDAVIQLGDLRLIGEKRGQKAQELFSFITSNEFQAQFKGIADAVADLREQQQTGRDWHEHAWSKESELFDVVDKCRARVTQRIRFITRDAVLPGQLKVVRRRA